MQYAQHHVSARQTPMPSPVFHAERAMPCPLPVPAAPVAVPHLALRQYGAGNYDRQPSGLWPGIQVADRCLSVRREGGGDYGDVLQRSGGTVGLVMADVAGHDAEAARIADSVRNTLRTHAYRHLTPAVVATLMNCSLHQEWVRTERFVTMLYAMYAPQTNILRYANAGHHPLILVRNGVCRLLSTGDMLLGVVDTATFTEGEVTLRHGDVLVAYTDGIIEARNAGGTMFGVERLCRIVRANAGTLSPGELLDAVYAEIIRHTGSVERNDDQTMLVMKVTA